MWCAACTPAGCGAQAALLGCMLERPARLHPHQARAQAHSIGEVEDL